MTHIELALAVPASIAPAVITLALQEPFPDASRFALTFARQQEGLMDSIIYLVGLVVVVMAILSFLGLR